MRDFRAKQESRSRYRIANDAGSDLFDPIANLWAVFATSASYQKAAREPRGPELRRAFNTKQNCRSLTNGLPSRTNKIGGSGRAAPREEVRV